MTANTSSTTNDFARISRGVITLHVTALVTQVLLAIAFVAGITQLLSIHGKFAWAVLVLGIGQAAVLFLPNLKAGRLYKAMVIVIASAEIVQIYLGQSWQTGLHVTLGMIIWGLSLAVFIRTLDPEWTAS